MGTRQINALCILLLIASQSRSASPETLHTRTNRPDQSRYSDGMRIDQKGIPRAIYDARFKGNPASPEQSALAFLAQNASLLRLTNPLTNLRTDGVQHVPGGSHVRFTQMYKGIPVFEGDIVVSADQNGDVNMVVNNFKENIALPSTIPSRSSEDALQIAAGAVGLRGRATGKENSAILMVFRSDDDVAHLAYKVSMSNEDPVGDWRVFVDAHTGEVLDIKDISVLQVHRVQGSGYVFDPDPLTAARKMYNSPGFVDNNDADSDSLTFYRKLVILDSLTFEDGVYKLNGPYVTITDIESPAGPAFYSSSTPNGFRYTRSQQEFEAVNIYHHITKSYKYIESLGFSSETLKQVRIDPHGYQGNDGSHYMPSGNWMAFGDGGVDDAEDPDVILHEYGHAIQFNFVPTWGGGETGALGEGFADYWAGSYSRSHNRWNPADYHFNWVFHWDGHNPFWLGRILNDTRTYPFGSLEIHTAGQIWSSALMGIQGDLGREATDRLVLKSLFYLGSNATGPDNAHAIIQADRDLYGGAHLQTLVYWLGTVKRFINPSSYMPVITHAPLTFIQDIFGPYTLTASISSAAGFNQDNVKVVWGRNGTLTDTTHMVGGSLGNEFFCSLPGIGAVTLYSYYITVADSNGTQATFPINAPLNLITFQAGNDSTPPAIEHTQIHHRTPAQCPVNIRAAVTDNLLVDSVWIEYRLNTESNWRQTRMLWVENNVFESFIGSGGSSLRIGDSITYRILARDRSILHNFAALPANGYFMFHIVDSTSTGLIAGDNVPRSFTLGQNYPNPFNPSTSIQFALPEEAYVILKVFNILGQEVATLADGIYPAGRYVTAWNTSYTGEAGISSGVYFYRLEAQGRASGAGFVEVRKMSYLK
jgi:Zn-dependent metalloprotease